MGEDVSFANRPSSYSKLVSHPVGRRIENIYLDRLKQFIHEGEYRNELLLGKLYNSVVSGPEYIKLSVYSVPELKRISFKEAVSHEFTPTNLGSAFGPAWSTHWFKIQLTIPKNLLKEEHLELHWEAGNEGLIWNSEGHPLQGLTKEERQEWVIPQTFRDGQEHVFYIEMACNGMFGCAPGDDAMQPPDPNKKFVLSKADIVAVNLSARSLFYDFQIVEDAARKFPTDSWEQHEAVTIASSMMDTFIAGNGSNEAIQQTRKLARHYLGNNSDTHKVYDSNTRGNDFVYAIGHCHIDTCWLWPFAETKRKVARSWSNQCDLMDRYPEHRFTCSQAQQFKWLEQNYPSVFERVKGYVKKGRFQPIGGSWVEHDTNMPSGESLVRQFLYGQRYFEETFGSRCRTFWLPDTFGYSSQLPQICQLAGMNRFFTQKLSWNNINKFPHTTFNWVALDGSQVLCHMAPSETYTAQADFEELEKSVTQHRSLDQDKSSLLVFGKGDGGGGPTFHHLEKLRRLRGLSERTTRIPGVKMNTSVEEFYDRLEDKTANGVEFATWYGELYFELHRGTYTTQAKNKYNNRKGEFLLRDIELLATLATLSSNGGTYKYPKERIDEMWESVLLCQFHDCLPGSSIGKCYEDTDIIYSEVFSTGEKLKHETLRVLGFSTEIKSDGDFFALNTLPWHRSEIVKLPKALADKASRYALFKSDIGVTKSEALEPSQVSSKVQVEEVERGMFRLSNSRFVLHVKKGVITSLYDVVANRQVFAPGTKGAQLVIFDDKPLTYQAWDVEVYHLNSRTELPDSSETKIVENSPLRASVMTRTKISEKSWAETTISLNAAVDDDPYVEIETEVEWQESNRILKAEFPVNVRSTEASYETQYGITRRPTHYNTSWDMAKFEVCSHKWADLSEHGYGVSILNDSKYGFSTAGNVMRLSLLRAPKLPDPNADMGRHRIRYAILPHVGPLDHRVVRAGYNFNDPLTLLSRTRIGEGEVDPFKLIRLTGSESLVLDTVKRGEDDEDVLPAKSRLPRRKGRSVILRVYDSLGGTSVGQIHTALPVKRVWKTNILEDDEEHVELSSDLEGQSKTSGLRFDITLRPFEVATYRLHL